jgi:hypothetical protein
MSPAHAKLIPYPAAGPFTATTTGARHPREAQDSAVQEAVDAPEMGWHLGRLSRREGLIAAAAENPSGTGQQNRAHAIAFVAFARNFFEFLSQFQAHHIGRCRSIQCDVSDMFTNFK